MNVAYNQDCVEGMREINDDFIDLTVTSPPYDDLRTYDGFTFDYEKTICELFRITKPGGVVVWIVCDQTANGTETLTSFKQAIFAKSCGFNVHDTMIWRKDSFSMPETNRYNNCFEYMFIWSKGKPKTFNPIKDKLNKHYGSKQNGTIRERNGKTRKREYDAPILEYGARLNIWDINAEKNNTTGHPAVFPYRLAADHIKTWSNENDIVLDPFLGSGTTRLAAYDLHRQFIGFEISERFFNDQEKRYDAYTSQLTLL